MGARLTAAAIEPHHLPGYAGVVAIDALGVIQYVTPEFDGLRGIRVDDMLGRSFLDFIDEEDARQAMESFTGVHERSGYHQALEIRVKSDEGSFVVDFVADNRLDDPDICAVLLHLADPRDRRRSAQLLDRQAEIVRQIALGGSLSSAIGEILAFAEHALPGFRAVAFLVENGRVVLSKSESVPDSLVDGVAAALSAGLQLPATEALHGEEIIVAVDLDDPRWATMNELLAPRSGCVWSVPIRFDRGEPVVGCIDIYGPSGAHPRDEDWAILRLASRLIAIAVDHAHTQELLVRDAEVDPLTGAANRRVITSTLEQMLEREQFGRAVCFIDLDRLKVVNDSLGHEAGDRVICEAADRLTALVGSDGLVGRFGGDEFIAIADSASIECEVFAQRCVDAFAEPILIDGRAWRLSASVGAVVVDEQRTPSEVLRDADTAMYEAKRAGRACWRRFRTSDRETMVRRLQLEQRLGDAIRHDEVAAWFQPIVNAGDWSFGGAESLARWEIEPGSFVAPNEFVPLAEEVGLIDDLGLLMLVRALEGMDELVATLGAACRVSVNVSPLQLRSDRLFAALEQVGEERQGEGGLCLEMTEQHMIDDSRATLARLERLTDLGVELSVDDFGTGYSSLAMLHRVPARTLKIDRALIRQVAAPSGAAVVAAVVAVAKAYGMLTVAEGVESVEEAFALRAMGLDQLQGFLFAPAEPIGTLIGRLSSGDWPWDVDVAELCPTAD